MSADVLDQIERIRDIDEHGMIDLVLRWPEQCQEGARIGREWKPSVLSAERPDHVVVSGLGGSGVVGDMIAALHSKDTPIPISTNRDYHLPKSAGENALVVCESYSGNTEEVLSACHDARSRGAHTISITSGGRLAEASREDGVDLVLLPDGMPSRAATGLMFVVTMFVLEKLGLIPVISDQLPRAVDLLKRSRDEWLPEVQTVDNEAKLAAEELHGRIPVIYGAAGVAGVVAHRWKTMINENAKVHAFANVFPEINSNEMMGWELASLESESFAAVFVRDPADVSCMSDKMRVISTLVPRGFVTRDLPLRGETDLEKLLWGVFMGDLMSVYLAVCYEIDPTAVTGIDRLKEEITRIA